MPPPSDPRNLRAKWQRALEERRKAGLAGPPVDVTPGKEQRAARPAIDAKSEPPSPARETKDEPIAKAPLDAKAAGTIPGGGGEGGARGHDEEASPREDAAANKAETSPTQKNASKDEESAKKKNAGGGSSVWSSIGAALILVGGVGFALRTFLGPDTDSSGDDDAFSSTATTTAKMEPELPPEPAKPQAKAHCAEPSKQAFVVGDAPAPKPAGTTADPDDPPEDELAPFAVEIGRGVPFGTGFAVGTQRQAEGGTVSMVATLHEDGGDGKLVRLARSRGDFDPPVVASAGSSLLAAMIEPNAGGRAIKIAKIEGDRVTWGPELSEGRDESLAVDLAATGARAIVVWDDVPQGHERSVIDLATFDVGTLRGSGGRAITPPTIDADQPRLAPRPGGYWLSYLVHGDAPTEPTAAKNDNDGDDSPAPEPTSKKPKKKPSKKADNNDDSDTEAAGEAIAHTWIELLPLDENGTSVGAARAVTPKDGRVIGYDLEDGADGSAVLLYREDDTPNGSNGGQVKSIVAELGGVGEPRVIAEEGVGAGVPQLFGSWVVIHSMSGPVQIGALGPKGDIASEMAPEKLLGHGEVIAASNGAFLIGTPAGRAMKLAVARCAR
ncbi:MAG: hypothetical protein U0441_09505 [Polyangiaceae bacterium]